MVFQAFLFPLFFFFTFKGDFLHISVLFLNGFLEFRIVGMGGDDLDFKMFSLFSLSLFSVLSPQILRVGLEPLTGFCLLPFRYCPDCFETKAVLTEKVPCKSNTVVFKFQHLSSSPGGLDKMQTAGLRVWDGICVSNKFSGVWLPQGLYFMIQRIKLPNSLLPPTVEHTIAMPIEKQLSGTIMLATYSLYFRALTWNPWSNFGN